ncbi:MAG: hypothetical protein ABIB71_00785 [Candidatus Woesearchaeota archaeon]
MARKKCKFKSNKLEELTRKMQEAVRQGTYPEYRNMTTMELIRELRKN